MCGGDDWDPRYTSLPREWSAPAARAPARWWGGDDGAPRSPPLPREWPAPAARAGIEKLRRRRCAGTAVALAVVPSGEETPVGNVNLVRFSDDGLSAALGYWLVPAARGRGLATAAARLLCRWGFEELGLERIELLLEPGNAPSRRVAERLGAVPDGERPHPDHPDGPALLTFELTRTSMSP